MRWGDGAVLASETNLLRDIVVQLISLDEVGSHGGHIKQLLRRGVSKCQEWT